MQIILPGFWSYIMHRTDLASWHEMKQYREHFFLSYNCYNITIYTVIGSYLVITILLVPLSQGCNSNCIFQFTNTSSQVGNELDWWYCLHHPQSLDAKFWWLAEPVPEAPWYQPNLAHLLANTPNYWQQPFKACSCDKVPIVPYKAPGHKFNLDGKTSNCNYTLYYNHT